MSTLSYSIVRPDVAQVNLATISKFMFWLMFRNVASDGLVFDDPVNAGIVSAPGCVLASPSWENTATQVTQDYVYHWTRDAAIVALELSAAYAAGTLPTNQPLIDYVTFSASCQASPGDFDRAMTVQTGDLQQLANGAGAYAKVNTDIVELKPGGSATVDVVIRPSGTAGAVVSGTLYLDDVATSLPPDGDATASEVSALPYSYTIGNPG